MSERRRGLIAAAVLLLLSFRAIAVSSDDGDWSRLTLKSVDKQAITLRFDETDVELPHIKPIEKCHRDVVERAKLLFSQDVYYVRRGAAKAVFAPRRGEVVDVGLWLVSEGLASSAPKAPDTYSLQERRARAAGTGAWADCGRMSTTTATVAVAPIGLSDHSPWTQIGDSAGISPKLLYAIATGESGLRGVPHPWTLNVRGKSYYFKTREAAWKHASDLVANGEEWFDVGLMQIHWRIHKGRFTSLWDAFDVNTNIAAGAAILKENYLRTKSVTQAVAHYHSADPARNTPYVRSVAALLDRQSRK